MVMTDPIADMLTRIRNAIKANKDVVEVPSSNVKIAIAKILKSEGFIEGYDHIEDGKQGMLRLVLKYVEGESVIHGLKRVSKPGRRVFKSKDDLPVVMGGLGIVVVSTSKGVLTGEECMKKGVGGEVICEVW